MPTRTEKRRKVWARSFTVENHLAASIANPQIVDLLAEYKAAAGILSVEGYTVMRMMIKQWEVGLDDHTKNANISSSHAISWQPDQILTLADGNSALPNPVSTGFRETRWLHRWDKLFYLKSGIDDGQPALNTEGNPFYDGESHQMGKCPGPNFSLARSSSQTGSTTTTVSWQTITITDMWLALP